MERFLKYYEFFCKILFKNINSTYEFTLKERPKVKMENFLGTKSWRKFLEGLKRKINVFIGTKNIFNPKNKVCRLNICRRSVRCMEFYQDNIVPIFVRNYLKLKYTHKHVVNYCCLNPRGTSGENLDG